MLAAKDLRNKVISSAMNISHGNHLKCLLQCWCSCRSRSSEGHESKQNCRSMWSTSNVVAHSLPVQNTSTKRSTFQDVSQWCNQKAEFSQPRQSTSIVSKRAYRAYNKALVYECANRGYDTTQLTLLPIDRHITALKTHQVTIDVDADVDACIVYALCLPSSMKDVDLSVIYAIVIMTMLVGRDWCPGFCVN